MFAGRVERGILDQGQAEWQSDRTGTPSAAGWGLLCCAHPDSEDKTVLSDRETSEVWTGPRTKMAPGDFWSPVYTSMSLHSLTVSLDAMGSTDVSCKLDVKLGLLGSSLQHLLHSHTRPFSGDAPCLVLFGDFAAPKYCLPSSDRTRSRKRGRKDPVSWHQKDIVTPLYNLSVWQFWGPYTPIKKKQASKQERPSYRLCPMLCHGNFLFSHLYNGDDKILRAVVVVFSFILLPLPTLSYSFLFFFSRKHSACIHLTISPSLITT